VWAVDLPADLASNNTNWAAHASLEPQAERTGATQKPDLSGLRRRIAATDAITTGILLRCGQTLEICGLTIDQLLHGTVSDVCMASYCWQLCACLLIGFCRRPASKGLCVLLG